jgi:hypothetical protein
MAYWMIAALSGVNFLLLLCAGHWRIDVDQGERPQHG